MNRLRPLQLVKSCGVVVQCRGAPRACALGPAPGWGATAGTQGSRGGSTAAAATKTSDAGFVRRLLKRAGWLEHSRSRLRVSGYLLYENVADKVDYPSFFKEFSMPDTFLSWFVVTELHVWMLMARAMAEGKEGSFVRNCMVRAMWDDVAVRAKKLENVSPTGIREQLVTLSEEFQASLFGYDEGLLSNDKVLAGALWRRFFQLKCNDPEHIEILVQFVRQQVKLLDSLRREELLLRPNISWTACQKPPLV